MTTTTNRQHCQAIAETLEMIAEGSLYRCPECGEYVNANDYADDADLLDAIEAGDDCKCPECGELVNFEQVSVYDWLEGALDYEYTIDSSKQYKGVRIMVACGGPNIYVNTITGRVELYWWNERADYPISSEACQAIDDAMEELYNC